MARVKAQEKRINVRATEDEVKRVVVLQNRLQQASRLRNTQVTQRTVVLEALDALERYLDKEGM